MAKAKAREKDQAPLNILGRLKILRQMKDGLVRKSMPMFMVYSRLDKQTVKLLLLRAT